MNVLFTISWGNLLFTYSHSGKKVTIIYKQRNSQCQVLRENSLNFFISPSLNMVFRQCKVGCPKLLDFVQCWIWSGLSVNNPLDTTTSIVRRMTLERRVAFPARFKNTMGNQFSTFFVVDKNIPKKITIEIWTFSFQNCF